MIKVQYLRTNADFERKNKSDRVATVGGKQPSYGILQPSEAQVPGMKKAIDIGVKFLRKKNSL
jgi:hypothetical protein